MKGNDLNSKDAARLVTAAYLAAAYSSWAYGEMDRRLRLMGLSYDSSAALYKGYCDTAKVFAREAAEALGFGAGGRFAAQCDAALSTIRSDFSSLLGLPDGFKPRPEAEWRREGMTTLEASDESGTTHYAGQLLAAAYIVAQVGFEVADAVAERLRQAKAFRGAPRRFYGYMLAKADRYTSDFNSLLRHNGLEKAFAADYDRYRQRIMIVLGVSGADL